MGPENIQAFLNSKVPTCDTWGTQSYAGTTRGAYGTSRGYPPPYRCLKDYYENIDTKENNLQGRPVPAGSKSAAQIIYYYAQQYNINPQTLLTLLQKEQTLITDDWPWDIQYRSATGYGCPDGSPCDSQYYGFSNQVRWAARMYQAIGDNDPDWYSPYIKGTNFVYYNPNTGGCGGTNVSISNWSTASLYSYTPYQPNQAALNNLYGTGDGCSSYGNRNFWRLFNDWFGSTELANANIVLSQPLTTSTGGGDGTVHVGDTVTASYEVKNTADISTYVGGLGICARLNGQFYDFGFADRNTLSPQGTTTITYSKTMDRSGTLSLFVCSYNESMGGWVSDMYPYSFNPPLTRNKVLWVTENPAVTAGISLSPTNPGIGQPVTATITLRNASNNPINMGSLVVAGRDGYGNNVDFDVVNDVTLAANGGTYTYSKTRTFSTPGNHRFYIASWKGTWSTDRPASADSSIVRQLNTIISDNPLVTTGISLSPSSPAAGQAVTATFTIRNVATTPINIGSLVLAVRDAAGNNVDFGIVNDVTVPANGGTYTYSKTRTLGSGTYNLYIANWNGVWSTSKPKSIDESIVRQRSLVIP
jgi:hypothetical protein